MRSRVLPFFLLVIALHAGRADVFAADFSPSPLLVSTIKSTLGEIGSVLSILSTFSGPLFSNDCRAASAVQDYVDLLSLSSTKLDWTLSSSSPTTQSATEKLSVGTGNAHYDLRSWLSAALGNQETCSESLQDTDNVVKSLVLGSLGTISFAGLPGTLTDSYGRLRRPKGD